MVLQTRAWVGREGGRGRTGRRAALRGPLSNSTVAQLHNCSHLLKLAEPHGKNGL